MAFLNTVSNERVAEELNKILVSPNPSSGLKIMKELGILEEVLPEFSAMIGMEQSYPHHKDVWGHTCLVVENMPPVLHLRMAGLMHDVGKPKTKSVSYSSCSVCFGKGELSNKECRACRGTGKQGVVHFYNHENVGARMTRSILERLRYSNDFIHDVSRLVELHMRPNVYDSSWSNSAVRRLMFEAGEQLDDLLTLCRGDITGRLFRETNLANVGELENRCKAISEQENIPEICSPLDGNELMELFNLRAGAWIRPLKEHLQQLVVDGILAPEDKETAKKIAVEFYTV